MLISPLSSCVSSFQVFHSHRHNHSFGMSHAQSQVASSTGMQQTLTPWQVDSLEGVVPLCAIFPLTLLFAHPTTEVALSRGHTSMAARRRVHSCFVLHVELWIWQGPDNDQEEAAVKSSFHLLNKRGNSEMPHCFVKMPIANMKLSLFSHLNGPFHPDG
jgi:hypothetical protein